MVKEYPDKLPIKEAIANFDNTIDNERQNKFTQILAESENGCVILVASHHDANILAGQYTEWCICNYEQSWKQYSKNKVQLFIFDATQCNPYSMLGVTFRWDSERKHLLYTCAFYGNDEEFKAMIPKVNQAIQIEDLLRKVGNFTMEELEDYLHKIGYDKYVED